MLHKLYGCSLVCGECAFVWCTGVAEYGCDVIGSGCDRISMNVIVYMGGMCIWVGREAM